MHNYLGWEFCVVYITQFCVQMAPPIRVGCMVNYSVVMYGGFVGTQDIPILSPYNIISCYLGIPRAQLCQHFLCGTGNTQATTTR